MTLVVALVLVELWLLLLARLADWRQALVAAAVIWSMVLVVLAETLHVLLRESDNQVRLQAWLVSNATATLARTGPEPCALASLAFGRMRDPEAVLQGRFQLVWHEGLVALYLPAPSSTH